MEIEVLLPLLHTCGVNPGFVFYNLRVSDTLQRSVQNPKRSYKTPNVIKVASLKTYGTKYINLLRESKWKKKGKVLHTRW